MSRKLFPGIRMPTYIHRSLRRCRAKFVSLVETELQLVIVFLVVLVSCLFVVLKFKTLYDKELVGTVQMYFCCVLLKKKYSRESILFWVTLLFFII